MKSKKQSKLKIPAMIKLQVVNFNVLLVKLFNKIQKTQEDFQFLLVVLFMLLIGYWTQITLLTPLSIHVAQPLDINSKLFGFYQEDQ
jgi:hypothetical protein